MYRSEVMSLLKVVTKVPLTSVKPVISSVCVEFSWSVLELSNCNRVHHEFFGSGGFLFVFKFCFGGSSLCFLLLCVCLFCNRWCTYGNQFLLPHLLIGLYFFSL